MRGEHQITNVLLDNLPGSSPHARGTPGKHSIKWSGTGIIPACAGNTACAVPQLRACCGIIPACAGNTMWVSMR